MKTYNSLEEIRSDMKQNVVSCLDLVNFYLARIEENKELNAFLEVYVEEAIEQAKQVDQKIRDGKAGKLAGMVIAIKDNICYKDHHVSASSKILKGFKSLFSATVVEKLLEEDAIIIGRCNCDEFAMGSSNENSAYGVVKNPIDRSRVPGGSSGGSVAAVAANLCLAALGSDTGGSIRQPASYCGVYGSKPSYGRVSRYGLIAFASSLDQIGPVTRSLSDNALLLEVISGNDKNDSTSAKKEVEKFSTTANDYKPKKVAVLSEYLNAEGLDADIKSSLLEQIENLKAQGIQVDEVPFPYLDLLVPTYYVLSTAEASSNLSRYGGILYGYQSERTEDINSAFVRSRSEGFGWEVKRRIILGTFVLSTGFYDAYYGRAQKIRRLIKDKTEEIFKDYDLIISPTTPGRAFEIGSISDPIKMYLEDIFTVQAPLAGLPAISVPFKTEKSELPFGIQLMAGKFQETKLLACAKLLKGRLLN
ncbi:MAG: Asp-tRNA(Asn)/Glu-tRNA(Gln) amidotransferase subunit GatA [Bacteroidia bacterium]|nr:Asp-tRNA(Asn)/Glu-tRNA(Gln) amidotransferase subunit GatA [Bacteroidia bacterium]